MSNTPALSEHGHGAGRGGLAFAALGSGVCLLTAGQDGRIRVWDGNGDMLRESDASPSDGGFHALAVSPDASFLAVGDGNSVQVRVRWPRSAAAAEFGRV